MGQIFVAFSEYLNFNLECDVLFTRFVRQIVTETIWLWFDNVSI